MVTERRIIFDMIKENYKEKLTNGVPFLTLTYTHTLI